MYQIYVTEGLRMIAENTSKYAGGTYMNYKFYDIIKNEMEPQEERTAEEVVLDILTRAEITIGGE